MNFTVRFIYFEQSNEASLHYVGLTAGHILKRSSIFLCVSEGSGWEESKHIPTLTFGSE